MGGVNNETLNFRQRQGHERESQQGQSLTHANEPGQTNANPAGAETVVDLSSDTSSSDINSDSSSVSGDENAYYGGYGRCFTCGECQEIRPENK